MKVGTTYALAMVVLPSCQNRTLATKNKIAKRMKNRVEKTSAFAQSVDNFNTSIIGSNSIYTFLCTQLG